MVPAVPMAAALLLALCSSVFAASGDDWRSRSIYQVLTDRYARTDGSTTAPCDTASRSYCGGSFKGIENHLDYIQNMGFDAVWISPITAQLQGDTGDGTSYHGFWQQDLYAINSDFGSPSDLQSLASALHSRGMYLMVDVVVNHFAYNGAPEDVDYSVYNPFNSYSQFHHPYCQINYADNSNLTNLQECWMGDTVTSLTDLRTEDEDVASEYQTWIGQLVSNYSIDGIRLDSAMEVNTEFWSGFNDAAGVFVIAEVYSTNVDFVCSYQQYLPGLMNYGTYFPLVGAFSSTSGSLSSLATAVSSVQGSCSDVSLLGAFIENQDVPRFASLTGDLALAKNVIAFTFVTDGIPIVYAGEEQHYNAEGGSNDPFNREALWFSGYNTTAPLYELIATLNSVRNLAIYQDSSFLTSQTDVVYNDTSIIATRKGQLVSVLSNAGSGGPVTSQSIGAGYSASTQLTEVLTCSTLTADGSGNINVPIAFGVPRVYYPTSSLSGSGLCDS